MAAELTKTEQRLMKVFSDGRIHSREELSLVIDPDGLNHESALRVHIFRMRRKLWPKGRDIVHATSVRPGQPAGYVLVINLAPAE